MKSLTDLNYTASNGSTYVANQWGVASATYLMSSGSNTFTIPLRAFMTKDEFDAFITLGATDPSAEEGLKWVNFILDRFVPTIATQLVSGQNTVSIYGPTGKTATGPSSYIVSWGGMRMAQASTTVTPTIVTSIFGMYVWATSGASTVSPNKITWTFTPTY